MIADILDIEKNLFSDEAFNNLRIIERDDLVYIIYTYTYDDVGTIRNTLYIRSISKDQLNSKITLDIDIDNINYFKDEFNVEIFINQSVSERVYEDYKLYDNYILNEVDDMFYITFLDVDLGVQTIAFETNSYLEDNVFVRYKFLTNESLFSTVAEYDTTDVDTMYSTRLLDVYFYKIKELYYYDLIYISDGEIFQELSKNVSFIKQTRLYDVIVDNGYTIDTSVGYNASINFQSKVNLTPGDNVLVNGVFSEIKLVQITDNGNTSYTYDILFVDSKQIPREKVSQIIRYRNDFVEEEVDGYYSMMVEEPKLIYVDENDIFGRENNDYELISYSMSDSKALLINYFYNIPSLKESFTMLCYNKYVMYTTTNDVFDENGLINFNTKIESFININVDEFDEEVYTNLFKDSVWVNETEIMSYGFTDSGSETYSISKINFGLGILEEKVDGIPSVSGFDFDGVTRISAYTNPTLNKDDTEFHFTVKFGEIISNNHILYRGSEGLSSTGVTGAITLEVYENSLVVGMGTDGTTFSFFSNQFNENDIVNFKVTLKNSLISIFIEDVLYSSRAYTYTTQYFPLYYTDSAPFGARYTTSGFDSFATEVLSNFIVYTDGEKVFEETFNNTTKGTITGTEQYDLLQEGSPEYYLIEKLKITNLSTSVPISNTIEISDFENIKTLYDVNRRLMIFIEDTDFQFFDVEETGLTIGTADNYYTNINTEISNSETYLTFKNSEKEYRLIKYKTVKDKYLNDGMILTKMLPLLPEYLQTNTKTQTIIDTLEQIQNANIQYSNFYYDSFETPILLGAYINNSGDDWMVNLLEINPNLYFFDSSNSYGMNPVLSTVDKFAENNNMLQIDDKYLIDMIKNNGLEYLYDVDYFKDLINVPFYEDTNGDFLDLSINSDRSRDILYNSNEINDYKNNLVYKSSQIDDEIRNIFNIIAKYSKYNSSKFFLELIVGLFSFNYSLKLSIKTNKNMIDINDLSMLGKIVDNKLYFYYDNDILEKNMSGLARSITFIEKVIQNFIPINFVYDGLLVKVNIQDEMTKKSYVEETCVIEESYIDEEEIFDVLVIGTEFPSEDVDGFDFDGETSISPYTNPTLNTDNTEFSFDLKKQVDSDCYIYNSGADTNNNIISIGFDSDDKLFFRLNLPPTAEFYLVSLSSISIYDVISVKLLLSNDGTNVTVSMYIDNVLQSVQTNESTIESFSFYESSSSSIEYDSTFGTQGTGDNEFSNIGSVREYNGKLYIADSNNYRIVITDLDGSNFTSFSYDGAGSGTIGYTNDFYIYDDKIYSADSETYQIIITDLDGSNFTSFGSEGSGDNEFANVSGICVYNDKIYIADSNNNRIVITDLDGSNFTSFGSEGSGDNEFYNPTSLYVYDDKIYITEGGRSNRIVITDLDGSNFTSFGSEGSGDNEFDYAAGICVYNDKIYIADGWNNRIVITDLDGSNFTSFGSEGSGDNEYGFISNIHVSDDVIYIADFGNDRISISNIINEFDATFGLKDDIYLNSILGNFKIVSDNVTVFEETFDNTTLGEITGTEQYSLISSNQIVEDDDGYIITTIPQSQDDELYKYYNDQWNQLYPQINYTVLNLEDDKYYKYVDTGEYNLFVGKISDVDEVLDIVTTEPTNEVGFNEAYIYRPTSDHDMLSIYNGTFWESYYSYIGKQVFLKGQEDVFGFDFDGVTGIKGYTNPTINPMNNCYHLKIKFNDLDDNAQVLDFGEQDRGLVIYFTNNRLVVNFKYSVVYSLTFTKLNIIEGNIYDIVVNNYTLNNGISFNCWINGIEEYTENTSYIAEDSITQFGGEKFTIGLSPSLSSNNNTKSTISDFAIWDSSKTESEIESLFSEFSSDGSVFYESFNNTTLGTITGTEQYAPIQEGTEDQTLTYTNTGTYRQFV